MPLDLIKDREVANVLSVAVSTVWDYARTGVIPKPIKIGCSTRWVRSEIEIVIQERLATRQS